MTRNAVKKNRIKYGGKVLNKKALAAVIGAGLTAGAATVAIVDRFVRKARASEK